MEHNVVFTNPNDEPHLKDLVELLDLIFASNDAYKKAKTDGGGLNKADLVKVLDLIDDFQLGIEGVENIVSGYHSASDEGKAAVLAYIKERFDLEDDRAERKIEKALEGIAAFAEVALA